MREVEGHTSDEVLEIIQKVVDRIAPKYTFVGYDIDDMKQEAFIICVEALDRYNPNKIKNKNKPLESFLSNNLSNRIKNFLRDNNAIVADTDKSRIAQPAQLDNEYTILDGKDRRQSLHEQYRIQEISRLVNRNIPADMRMDYIKMINGEPIPTNRRKQIEEFIKHMLEGYGYNLESEDEQEDW